MSVTCKIMALRGKCDMETLVRELDAERNALKAEVERLRKQHKATLWAVAVALTLCQRTQPVVITPEEFAVLVREG